jgi:hypothetical protein
VRVPAPRSIVTRFQLVFRTGDVDRVELHDNNASDEPHLDGVLLLDGMIFARGGSNWLAVRDEEDGIVRFICTPVDPTTAGS